MKQVGMRAEAPAQETFYVRQSGEQGLGCFASRAIAEGELIIDELPLLRWTRTSQHATREEDLEGLHDAIESLVPSARTAYFQLNQLSAELISEMSEPDEVEKMRAMGIWMANAFQVGEPVTTRGARDSGAEVEQAVFERISRFNHCCRPNADHTWDNIRGRKSVRALRAIGIGEQIFVSYIGGASAVLHIPRAKRRERLQRMLGFACTCSRCVRGDEADDAFWVRQAVATVERQPLW